MVFVCCSPDCVEKQQKGGPLIFHTFPKDEIQRTKWIQNMRRENFVPSRNSRLCSKHFADECYETSSRGIVRLRRYAVPSIFISPHDMMTQKTTQNEGSSFQESETLYQFPNVTVPACFHEVILPISHSDYDDAVPCVEEICDPLAVDPLSEDTSIPEFEHNTSHVKTEVEENVHLYSVVQIKTPNVRDVCEELNLHLSNQDDEKIDYIVNRKKQLSMRRKSRKWMESNKNNCLLFANQFQGDVGMIIACISCKAVFDCKTSLKQHCICKGMVQSCAQCTSLEKNWKESRINRHKQKSVNGPSTLHECPECRELLSGPRKYLAHVKVHIMNSRQCSPCRELYSETDALKTTVCHHRLLTFNVADYQTSEMNKKTQNMEHLSCSTCEEVFPNASALECHCECLGKELCIVCVPHIPPCTTEQALCTETRIDMKCYVSCQVCGVYFPRRSFLTSHMKKHSKDYRCEVCGREFLQGKTLKQHLLKSTCRLKKKKSRTNKKTFRSDLLKCGLCSFITNNKDIVIRHLSTHTKEYSHKCFLCGKSFAKKWSLFRHEILHIGLRPYKCSICNATFSDAANRKAHEKLHLKVKRMHTCSLCDLQFIGRKTLFKHHLSNHITDKHVP